MKLPILLACVFFSSCSSVREVRCRPSFTSAGRHDGAGSVRVVTKLRNGVDIAVEGGRREPIYGPGEPRNSSRAPSAEWQGGAYVEFPIFRRAGKT